MVVDGAGVEVGGLVVVVIEIDVAGGVDPNMKYQIPPMRATMTKMTKSFLIRPI